MTTEGTQIALLNREVHSHSEILKSLTTATQEMGKVTNSIERMLMLHDQRIAGIDRVFLEVKHQLEKHEDEMNKEVQKMYDRIQGDSTELMTRLEASEDRILSKIEEMVVTANTKNTLTDARISALEKWQYALLVAGGVLGFVLHQGLPLLIALLTK